VPKIIINNTLNLFLNTSISILVISCHNSFGVLFDKIASVYFIWKMHSYFYHWKWLAQATQHCASCIGTLSSPGQIKGAVRSVIRSGLTKPDWEWEKESTSFSAAGAITRARLAEVWRSLAVRQTRRLLVCPEAPVGGVGWRILPSSVHKTSLLCPCAIEQRCTSATHRLTVHIFNCVMYNFRFMTRSMKLCRDR